MSTYDTWQTYVYLAAVGAVNTQTLHMFGGAGTKLCVSHEEYFASVPRPLCLFRKPNMKPSPLCKWRSLFVLMLL